VPAVKLAVNAERLGEAGASTEILPCADICNNPEIGLTCALLIITSLAEEITEPLPITEPLLTVILDPVMVMSPVLPLKPKDEGLAFSVELLGSVVKLKDAPLLKLTWLPVQPFQGVFTHCQKAVLA
jgi:hypothetical protein